MMKVLITLVLLQLTNCVFYPKKIQQDPECKTITREFVIDKNTSAGGAVGEVMRSCNDEACIVILLTALGVPSSTYVVSSGFALTGNTLNWLERSAKCGPEKQSFNWGQV